MMQDDAFLAQIMGNDAIVVPDGTRDLPARTCRHLAAAKPEMKDGWYWIDPNGGKISDAARVFCKFDENVQTCVEPKQDILDLKAYPTADVESHNSLSKLAGIGQLTYQLEDSQLAFLKMLSSHARQELIVNCSQTYVVDAQGEIQNSRAAILFTDNDKELYVDDPIFKYKVLRDDCKYGKSSIADTVIQVSTRAQRLPIRDVALAHLGEKHQEVGLKVGQVCFS
jgi:hypothetical protein